MRRFACAVRTGEDDDAGGLQLGHVCSVLAIKIQINSDFFGQNLTLIPFEFLHERYSVVIHSGDLYFVRPWSFQ